jgi:hypothetical protein
MMNNISDYVKIGLFAWLGVFAINHALIKLDSTKYTTKGE